MVAACFGGSLSFAIAGNGESVRRGVIVPLQPDVFIAGTLNGSTSDANWEARGQRALASIAALGPFTSQSIIPQPTTAYLREAIERSGFLAHYQRQLSKNGEGRLNPADADPRLWLPTMLSPAMGNPGAHTLREFHYQSRCLGLIEAHEESRGRKYGRVLFTRLEFEWLHPHPPLSLLDEQLTWIQAGEDNGGITDRHWLSNRADANVLMRRWEALLDGSALVALHGSSDLARISPVFVSSEIYLLRLIEHHSIRLGRFPGLAYLQCCEDLYLDASGHGIHSDHGGFLSTGDGATIGAKTCFQACAVSSTTTRAPVQS